MTRRHIGIFGGSFNPVHHGHINLARYIADTGLVSEVWLTLTPSNPLKTGDMASETDRLAMLQLAVKGLERVKVCDVELSMPQPYFTINTLDRLAATYPDCRFTLITGADNLLIFDKWHDYRRILSDYGLIVYPRPGYALPAVVEPEITLLPDAPMVDVSSTSLRQALSVSRGSESDVINPDVYQYILNHNLYR